MKLQLNLDTAAISTPFSEMLSTIVDYKNKVKDFISEPEPETRESLEEPKQGKSDPFKKLKTQLSKINFSFIKKVKFEKVKDVKDPFKKHPKIVLAVVAILLISGFFLLKSQGKTQSAQASTNPQGNFTPTQQVTINKQFDIPIRTAKGDESGDMLKVTLSTVDNTNKILIQGQPATARDSKSFLILNLEVENSTKNQLTVRPVDLIRMIDANNKSFAPDIHNNDVTVEAISIKKTRAGYVVDNSQKHFKFIIGEVSGKKETVEVNLN